MIELYWIALTLFAAVFAKVNDVVESHPLDWFVTMPVFPLVGVAGAFFVLNGMTTELTIGLVVRFVIAGLIGLAVVSAALIQFSPHFGPGGLGAFALHLVWWALGAVVIAGEAAYFLFRFFKR